MASTKGRDEGLARKQAEKLHRRLDLRKVSMKNLFSIVALTFLTLALISPATTQQAQNQTMHQTATARTTYSTQPSTVKPGLYWFQVGAYAANGRAFGSGFGISVTGASVEIQVRYSQHVVDQDGELAYWVGLNLPDNSFIQIGYLISASVSYPQWFWAYFLHDADKPSSTCTVTCPVGDEIGPNGTWYEFSLQASGTRWYAFVNGIQVGSVDLGVANSRGSGPYAVAEVAGTRSAKTILGPVAFRNLQYRDSQGTWHMSKFGVSLCCNGIGSDSYPGTYPYGIQAVTGEDNKWLAGSNLKQPIKKQGSYLWPWYKVTAQGLPAGQTFTDKWQIYGSTVNLPNIPENTLTQANSRQHSEGWYVNGLIDKGVQGSLVVTDNLIVSPHYVQQWFIQVTSPIGTTSGSGWHDDGSIATISVAPTEVAALGIFGKLGVRLRFSSWMVSPNLTANGPEVSTGVSLVNQAELKFPELEIRVKSPFTIQAIWTEDYRLLYSLLTITMVALVAPTVLLASKRIWPKRKEK
jgi:hypothetical protein